MLLKQPSLFGSDSRSGITDRASVIMLDWKSVGAFFYSFLRSLRRRGNYRPKLALTVYGLLVSYMSLPERNNGFSLKNDDDYSQKGVVETIRGGLNLYIVGTGPKCIIWNYNIKGFSLRRNRQLADLLADRGFMVIIPDYFRGKYYDRMNPDFDLDDFISDYSDWSKLKKDITDLILPYAKMKGAEMFGAVGTSWGSYLVLRMSSLPEIQAGVSLHPSHSHVIKILGEKEVEVLQDIKFAPQLFMPTEDDPVSVRNGGIAQQILGDKLSIIRFTGMNHNWILKGDLQDYQIQSEVRRAVSEMFNFLDEHIS